MLSAFLTLLVLLGVPAAYASDQDHAADQSHRSVPGMSAQDLSDLRNAKSMKDLMSPAQVKKMEAKQHQALDWFKTQKVRENTITQTQDHIKSTRQRLMELTHQINQSLGVRQQSGQLIVFLSHSMSDDFIRSYLHEGAWAGAAFYVRGIPAGMSIHEYMKKKLIPIIGKKKGVAISINPKMFDIYGVNVVPTIVWDPGKPATCDKTTVVNRKDNAGKPEPVHACDETHDTFYKISGGVSIDYALRAFVHAGAKGAEHRLKILRKNVAPANDGKKAQKPYSGDWSQVSLPGEQLDDLKEVPDRTYIDFQNGQIKNTTTVEGNN